MIFRVLIYETHWPLAHVLKECENWKKNGMKNDILRETDDVTTSGWVSKHV